MRREVGWLVVTFVIVLGTLGDERTVAQQLIDPRPVEEEPDLATDLPLPEHSLVVEPPARDNSRAFFGVTFDPQVRDAALARSVTADSPADLAGVQAGDIIVSLNGRPVGSYDDVLGAVDRLKPGDVLDIEVSRWVKVRTRAVLNGLPVGAEHTTVYRAQPESLPAPAGAHVQPPVNRVPANRAPANVNAPRPRQGVGAPPNRNTNRNTNENRDGEANRNNNSDDREQNNRFRGFLRRRG